MKKFILAMLTLVSSLLMTPSNAEDFYLGNEYLVKAYYPTKPVFLATMDVGGLAGGKRAIVVGYRSFDENSNISYTSLSQKDPFTGAMIVPESEIDEGLKTFVLGQIAGTSNPTIFYIRGKRIGLIHATEFAFSYSTSGLTVNKFAIAAYYKNRFVTWSVQDYGKASSQSAEKQYAKHVAMFLKESSRAGSSASAPTPPVQVPLAELKPNSLAAKSGIHSQRVAKAESGHDPWKEYDDRQSAINKERLRLIETIAEKYPQLDQKSPSFDRKLWIELQGRIAVRFKEGHGPINSISVALGDLEREKLLENNGSIQPSTTDKER